MPRPSRFTCSLTAALAALLLFTAAPASAQRDRDRWREAWDEPRPVAPTPMEEMRRVDEVFADDLERRRSGLLREGSHLLDAPASVRFEEDTRTWFAQLLIHDTKGREEEPVEMGLLPNSFLTELEQVIEATPGQRITFELTGETLVYAERNYLLMRAPARVVGLERIEMEQLQPGPVRPPAREVEEEPATPRRSAAEVIRELERETGPLHRTRPVPRAPIPTPQPTDQADQAEEPARPEQRGGVEGQSEHRMWHEGTVLVQRRGRVMRDPFGGFRFVLESDAQGLADPPLMIMPCLLLERIERFTRQAGPTAAVLMSGEVFVHDGRAYLLPSAFQLPRERTPLH